MIRKNPTSLTLLLALSFCTVLIQFQTQAITCPFAAYLDTTINDCLPCNRDIMGCEVCTYNTNTKKANCVACVSGMFLVNGMCQKSMCTQQQITLDDGTCQACSTAIAGCESCGTRYVTSARRAQCFFCTGGKKILSTGLCSTCTATQFSNTGTCTECAVSLTGCYSCTDAAICESCKPTFGKTTTNTCVACSTGTARCSKCALDAANAMKCSLCEFGYTLNTDGSACTDCSVVNTGCRSCSGTTCLACDYGLYPHLETTTKSCKECIIRFPFCKSCGYFLPTYKEQPKPIPQTNTGTGTGSTTTAPDASAATTVPTVAFNSPGNPILSCFLCETGRYFNATTQTCVSCLDRYPNCEECQSFDKFVEVVTGRIRIQDVQCLRCKGGGYFDPNAKSCRECSSFSLGCAGCQRIDNPPPAGTTTTTSTGTTGTATSPLPQPPIGDLELYRIEFHKFIGNDREMQVSLFFKKDWTNLTNYLTAAAKQALTTLSIDSIRKLVDYLFPRAQTMVPDMGGLQNHFGSFMYFLDNDMQDKRQFFKLFFAKTFTNLTTFMGTPFTTLLGTLAIDSMPKFLNYVYWKGDPMNQVDLAGIEKYKGSFMSFFSSANLDGVILSQFSFATFNSQVPADLQSIFTAQLITSWETLSNFIEMRIRKAEAAKLSAFITIQVQCNLCQSGYAYDAVNRRCVTAQCDPNCEYCFLNLNLQPTCKWCKNGFNLNVALNKCDPILSQCLQGEFLSATGVCERCNNVIAGGIANCYACNFGRNETDRRLTCHWCEHNFEVGTTSDCTPKFGAIRCIRGCSDCLLQKGFVSCTACDLNQNYAPPLSGATGMCVLNCVAVGLEGCQRCSENFIDSNWVRQCFECQAGKIMKDGRCVTPLACAAKQTYYPRTNLCVPCPLNCLGCRIYEIQTTTTTATAPSSTVPTTKLLCDFCDVGYSPNADGSCQFTGATAKVCEVGCLNCQWDDVRQYLKCLSCDSTKSMTLETDANGFARCKISCAAIPNCADCYLFEYERGLFRPQCAKCNANFQLTIEKQCGTVQSCGTGQFYNPSKLQCQACLVNCVKCQWNGFEAQCTYCASGYKLSLNGQCTLKQATTELSCPPFTYDSTTNCVRCTDQRCRSCDVNTPTLCRECDIGFSFNNDLQACKEVASTTGVVCAKGTYKNPQFASCLPCAFGCGACVYDIRVNDAYCQSCVNQLEYFLNLDTGKCMQITCPLAKYFTKDRGCQDCPPSCVVCHAEPTLGAICDRCEIGFTRTTTGACQFLSTDCPAGTISTNSSCIKCPEKCSTCSFVKTADGRGYINCLSCESGFAKQHPESIFCTPSTCQNSDKFFGFGLNDQKVFQQGCYPCSALGCNRCMFNFYNNIETCLGCLATFRRIGSTCVPNDINVVQCLKQQVRVLVSTTEVKCVDCPPGCLNCTYSTWNLRALCNNCDTNFKLDPVVGLCVPLPGAVSITCSTTQYFNFFSKSCVNCPEGCGSCETNTWSTSAVGATAVWCKTCTTGYQFNQGRCQKSCDAGKYAATDMTSGASVCLDCGDNCNICNLDYSTGQSVKVCFQCKPGFYNRDKSCVALPNCKTDFNIANGYLFFEQTGFNNFQPSCKDCPKGCLNCKLTNPSQIFSEIVCESCDTGFTPNKYGQCIRSIEATRPECAIGTFPLLSTTNIWECRSCGDSCTSCAGIMRSGSIQIDCRSCKTGFIPVFQEAIQIQQCQPVKSCPAGEFATIVDTTQKIVGCKGCPVKCTACTADNVFVPTPRCSGCKSGYTLSSSGECNIAFTGQDLNIVCASNEFAIVIESIFCQKCPPGCSKCVASSAQNTASTDFRITCSACDIGFVLKGSFCTQNCTGNSFFDPLSSTCKPCHPFCQGCSGPTFSQCFKCGPQYQLSADGTSCMKLQTPATTINCGLGSFFDQFAHQCRCENSTYYFSPTTKTCQAINDIKCGAGQYQDETSTCQPCASTDGQQRCQVCTGAAESSCVACRKGFYFNSTQRSCQACSTNCADCQTQDRCELCSPGNYLYLTQSGGAHTTSCLSQCPAGYLPWLPSLVLLNTDIFKKEEIFTWFKNAKKPVWSEFAGISTQAIAIGFNNEPIFEITQLPYELQSNVPYYASQKIVLQCSPCEYNCGGNCAEGGVWIPDRNRCFKGQFCPNLYVKTLNTNTQKYECIVPAAGTFAIRRIQLSSLDMASRVQPLHRPFTAQIFTTFSNTTTEGQVSCSWSLISVDRDTTQTIATQSASLSSSQAQLSKSSFLANVNLNLCFLSVSNNNLEADMFYVLQGKATYQGTSLTETVSFTTRRMNLMRRAEELGITAKQIYVTPSEGPSGKQQFTAGFSFGQIPAFLGEITGVKWKFRIQIGTFFSITTTELNFETQFTVPDSATKDQIVVITFKIMRGEDSFEAERRIKATASPTFDFKESPLYQSITSKDGTPLDPTQFGAVGASLTTLAGKGNTACAIESSPERQSLLKTQGPCTPGEADECCGKGKCVTSKGSKFRCECQTGFDGPFCTRNKEFMNQVRDLAKQAVKSLRVSENDTFTPEQVGGAIDMIQGIVQTGAGDKDLLKIFAGNLKSIAKRIDDADTLSKFLEATQSFVKNVQSSSDNATESKSHQIDALRSVIDSISSFALQSLSRAEGKLSLTINSGDIVGQMSIVDPTTTTPVPMSLARPDGTTLSASVPPSAFAGSLGDSPKIQILSQPFSLTSVDNATDVTSDSLIELSVLDSDGKKIVVKNLTGTCPIEVDFEVPESKLAPGRDVKCTYFDDVNNTFSEFGSWMKNNSRVVVGGIIKFKCCYSHMTSYSSSSYQAQEVQAPSSGGNTQTPTQSEVFLGFSVLLISILTIIMAIA